MQYETLLVARNDHEVSITLNRLDDNNSINNLLLQEINQVFDMIESEPYVKTVMLKGQNGLFCSGMDFNEATEGSSIQPGQGQLKADNSSTLYMETIKRLSLLSRITVSLVDGQVTAGGIGLLAASDLVIATPRSRFSLSEALWGLLPACVSPYLIRRIGFQNAYRMTLTTIPVDAGQAKDISLVDEVAEEPYKVARRYLQRMMRLELSTIGNLKNFFREMWIINEDMENFALTEIDRLRNQPQIQENLRNFIEFQRFPWEKDGVR